MAPAAFERGDAVERARHFAPFLREAIAARPEIAEAFLSDGARAAVEVALAAGGDERRCRAAAAAPGLALAVSLGDLAGELDAGRCHRLPLRLRRRGDRPRDRGRLCGAGARASRRPASRSSRSASSAAASSISRPTSTCCCCSTRRRLPRRQRDEAGEAAVRIGRRVVELLQKRTEDGYVARVDLRLRPSPEATPIVLPVNAAISYYESAALAWERAAFIRARACAGDLALGRRFLQAIEPFVWRRALDFGAIDEIREIGQKVRDHYASRPAVRPRLRPQARARRHPRGRVLRPGAAAGPWRPRSRRCAQSGDAAGARRAAAGRSPGAGAGERAGRGLPARCGRSSIACR